MKVTLKNHTPLWVCSDAIRTCWQSQDKSDSGMTYYCNKCDTVTYDFEVNWLQQPYCSECGSTDGDIRYEIGENDKKLINKVGNKNKHSSTLEHLTYNFHIYDISRALLQELARHRIASLSVKSTRYTLKELKNEEHFMNDDFLFHAIASEEFDQGCAVASYFGP
jgi:thymidylate synthase (FAD)